MRGFVAMLAGTAALAACGGHSGPGARSAALPEPLPAPRVVAGTLDARALLGDLGARAARLGAGEPSLVASAEVIDNGWVGGFVDVPRDDCVLGYARGSSSIDDVDAAIYSEEGTTLAVDEGRDVNPTVLMCPRRIPTACTSRRARRRGRRSRRGGSAARTERSCGHCGSRARRARGPLAGQGPRPAEAWPGLDEAVRSHRAELGGTWQEFRRVALAVDARLPTDASLPIEADGCVDAVIVPDEDVALLDVEASLDADGRVIGRAREASGALTLTVCSSTQVTGTLSVRPHVGRGLAAVVLARAPGDVSRDLAALPEIAWDSLTSQPLDKTRSARNALLAKSGYEAPVATASGTLTLGRRISLPLDPKPLAGACGAHRRRGGRAPRAPRRPGGGADSGALLASAEASASLALFVCGRAPAHLELETRGRAGPFATTLRPERWNDPLFEAHPLAASRMLARAATGPDALLDGKEFVTRELTLDGERAVSWSENIPAGKCLRATLGAQGDGAGVEVRVFEGTEELDRSEAAHAASC